MSSLDSQKKHKILLLHRFTRGQSIGRAGRARDLLEAVNDCLVVRTAAFPVIWVGAKESLGRDRKQSVMYKI